MGLGFCSVGRRRTVDGGRSDCRTEDRRPPLRPFDFAPFDFAPFGRLKAYGPFGELRVFDRVFDKALGDRPRGRRKTEGGLTEDGLRLLQELTEEV
jgi:hypothetical protein